MPKKKAGSKSKSKGKSTPKKSTPKKKKSSKKLSSSSSKQELPPLPIESNLKNPVDPLKEMAYY